MDDLDPIVVGQVKDKIQTFVMEQFRQTDLSIAGKPRTDRGYSVEIIELAKDVIKHVKQHGQS